MTVLAEIAVFYAGVIVGVFLVALMQANHDRERRR